SQLSSPPLAMAVSVLGVLVLTGLFFFDLLYLVLPDAFVFTGIAAYAAYDIVFRGPGLDWFVPALLMAAFFGILFLISRGEWLGFGDVKLVFLIGLMLPYPFSLGAVVMAIWAGALVA